MAGSAAFDFVVSEELKKSRVSSDSAPEEKTGPTCNINWNPTIEDIEDTPDSDSLNVADEYMSRLSPDEKATVAGWSDLLGATGPPRKSALRKPSLKALTDSQVPQGIPCLEDFQEEPDEKITSEMAASSGKMPEPKMDNEEEKMPEVGASVQKMPDLKMEDKEEKMPEVVASVQKMLGVKMEDQEKPDEKMADVGALGHKMPEVKMEDQEKPDEKMADVGASGHKTPEVKMEKMEEPVEKPAGTEAPDAKKSRKRPLDGEKVTFANRSMS